MSPNPHISRAQRRAFLRRHAGPLSLLCAVALTTAILFIGVASAQENQIVTYGPWKGYWTKARLSAYSPHDALDREYHESKGERWRWITADGTTDVRQRPHGIAAPSSLPFGTRIFIPVGYSYLDESRATLLGRVFPVDDRGSAIDRRGQSANGIFLDVRYRTEHSALAFGVKDAWVFIIVSEN